MLLDELDRVRGGLQLIASENFASPAVLAALGSTLTNKYAEGFRAIATTAAARSSTGENGSRSSGRGAVRRRARQRAAALGASANLAAYAALLRPGDTVLAIELPHGGHLTHGSPVNFSGRGSTSWLRGAA